MKRVILLLVIICLAVAGAGVAWPAWDMFGRTHRPMLQGWDDSFYYFWLPSVVIDHDLDFANQLAHSGTMDPAMRDLALKLPRTRTGLLDTKYPPGWAIGSLPFFLLAHLYAPPNATGFEPIYLIATWLGQLLYAAAGLWLAFQIVRRYFPAHIATIAVLLGWLTSPLVYYQTARLSMSHSQVFVLAMLVFWLALQLNERHTSARNWILLGFSSALLVVTRNVAVVYLTLPAWVLVRNLRSLESAAWLALGAAAPIAVQLVSWKILYGSWLAYSYGGERFNFSDLHLVGVLFSPLHGWFYWHPLLLAGIAAFLVWGWRRAEGRAWAASLLVIVLLDAAWPTWWLGSSFGHRGFEVPTFFAMIGFAMLLQASSTRLAIRNVLIAIAMLAVVWNLALLTLFLAQRIPREERVTYSDAGRALATWVTGER